VYVLMGIRKKMVFAHLANRSVNHAKMMFVQIVKTKIKELY